MKRFLPWISLALGILWMAGDWHRPAVPAGEPDLTEFGRLPVLTGGRLQPLDTVARNSLLIIHGKQSVKSSDDKRVTALHWLADTLFDARKSDTYPVFVINHPEVLGLFGWQQSEKKYFSFNELSPFLAQIDDQGRQADETDSSQRSSYQKAILNLRNSVLLYHRLKNSIQPEGIASFTQELDSYTPLFRAGHELARTGQADTANPKTLEQTNSFIKRFETQTALATLLPIPPLTDSRDGREWISTGASLLSTLKAGSIHPVLTAYAQVGDAYRARKTSQFEQGIQQLKASLATGQPAAVHRAEYEFLFNQLQPFYRSMGLYVFAFLLASASWLGCSRPLTRSACWLLLLGLALHTFGLASRMYLQGRPPVTNLYSSAVFIGWGTVIVGLILERIHRDGIGAACAGAIGFLTLIIAHHLAASGDTLEMLQAVLDTNLWLATHVVVITFGYSAMFLAGMLALLYVVRGVFTKSLAPAQAKSLSRAVYGVVCFAALFSFLGTVLGGIWADQSWGRFWGWDPKENGALIIVLWCAVILHARWGGYVRDRGMIMMALFGNVITAFSWFGVNMLGVGLHSYGFMEKALPWLIGFMLSQIALIGIAAIPTARWRSFRIAPEPRSRLTEAATVS